MARLRRSPPTSDTLVPLPQAPIPASKLPAPLRFPLVVILSLSLSSLLYSLVAEYTPEIWLLFRGLWTSGGRLVRWWGGGRANDLFYRFELGLGWFSGFDGYDLSALTLLAHGPPLYLVSSFYNIHTSTVLSSLVVDCLATYIPFRLLRPLSPAHAVSSTSPVVVPNKDIVTDIPIQIYSTILAAAIYCVTIYTAYASYLPIYLVTYFSDLPSIVAAHTATPVSLFPLSLVLGLAVKTFIFTPATAVPESQPVLFDPEKATLTETFYYNLWGWSGRTKTVIQRTATLMLVSGVNTFVQSWVTLEGVEAKGALAYSGVWTLAAGLAGTALGLAGAV